MGGKKLNKKHQTFQREENTNIMMWNCKEQVKDAYTFILSAYVVIIIFLSVGLFLIVGLFYFFEEHRSVY